MDGDKILKEQQEHSHQTRSGAKKKRSHFQQKPAVKTQLNVERMAQLSTIWKITKHSRAGRAEQGRTWLLATRFVLEVSNKDVKEFPPNSLHHICCGILQHLHSCGNSSTDIFKDLWNVWTTDELRAEGRTIHYSYWTSVKGLSCTCAAEFIIQSGNICTSATTREPGHPLFI